MISTLLWIAGFASSAPQTGDVQSSLKPEQKTVPGSAEPARQYSAETSSVRHQTQLYAATQVLIDCGISLCSSGYASGAFETFVRLPILANCHLLRV